jgi:hypothetical protein
MALRTPTPRKSTDLQYGHFEENIGYTNLLFVISKRRSLLHYLSVCDCCGTTALRLLRLVNCHAMQPVCPLHERPESAPGF